MTVKLCRRLSPRGLAYCAIGLTILLCVYYASYTSDVNQNINQNEERRPEIILVAEAQVQEASEATQRPIRHKNKGPLLYDTCPSLTTAEADINTVDVYKDFEFQVIALTVRAYVNFVPSNFSVQR